MTRPYIIIEYFCEDGTRVLEDFDTVKKAAEYLYASNPEYQIGFVREVNRTINGHYFLDRTSDFIAAWREREREDLTDKWSELPTSIRGRLDGYLAGHTLGPAMANYKTLEAAE